MLKSVCLFVFFLLSKFNVIAYLYYHLIEKAARCSNDYSHYCLTKDFCDFPPLS